MEKFNIKIGRWILVEREVGKSYIKIGRWILHIGASSGCIRKNKG